MVQVNRPSEVSNLPQGQTYMNGFVIESNFRLTCSYPSQFMILALDSLLPAEIVLELELDFRSDVLSMTLELQEATNDPENRSGWRVI